MKNHKKNNDNLEQLTLAIACVESGLLVEPVKVPKSTKGVKAYAMQPNPSCVLAEPTSSIAVIREYCERFPDAYVAVPTGKTLWIVAVNIDPNNNGLRTLNFFKDILRLEVSPWVLNGIGGIEHHIYARPNDTSIPSGKFHNGFTLSGDDGYVIVHPNNIISLSSSFWISSDRQELALPRNTKAPLPEAEAWFWQVFGKKFTNR
jgi:hypothetical protein